MTSRTATSANQDQPTPSAGGARKAPRLRVPPNFFGIPFGVAGLAESWSAARPTLSAPAAVPNTLFILAAVLWAIVLTAYAAQGVRQVLSDVRDQIVAPFVSLGLIIPALLSAELVPYAATPAKVLVGIFGALTIVFGGWLTGRWIAAPVDLDALHPGYFLPTVAGGFVISTALSQAGARTAAEAAFGIGLLCWFLLGSLLLNRLFFRPVLPTALAPTLAIEFAPPAVGGLAYFALDRGVPDTVATALGGYTILMALVQLRLMPLYAKLRFSPALWAFTFAYAAGAAVALQWITIKRPPGATAYASIVIGMVTLLIGGIFIRTAIAAVQGKLFSRPAADQL